MVALSLDLYADTVVDAARGASEPVVLVGHSMAGALISRVAEEIPEASAIGLFDSILGP